MFDATMLGIGAMIGAGIFVLTGIAAGEAGPASLLAFALNGGVTLITAFAYAELASAIPRAGGGYAFVQMAYPGAMGFVSGWMLWFAYTVACSLYALGFAGYFWEFFHRYLPGFSEVVFSLTGEHGAILLVILLIGAGFILLNYKGSKVTGAAENVLTVAKLVVLGIFIYFGLVEIFRTPTESVACLFPFFPKGMGGVLIAMGLTFIAFEGYDLISTVAEEIKDPEKNIPRATFISLGVTMVMYLLILLVALAAIRPEGITSWEYLGKYQETAIVRAAENFMPAFGVALIVFGGLLSTMSALNATVLAASRVGFSMGRDKWLPQLMSKIHERYHTPHVAIVVTGVIFLLIALSLPIAVVGSAASLMFLLTFAMVNLSLIMLRRRMPEIERKYRMPLYPYLPIAGIVLNLYLAVYQFKFQPAAWYVAIGWVVCGLMLYYTVFKRQAGLEEPRVIVPRTAEIGKQEGKAVVVALSNPDSVEPLLKLGHAVAKARELRLVAVSVVEVPDQVPLQDGMRMAHHKRALLKGAERAAAKLGIKMETDVVIAHRVYEGIFSALEHQRGELLVMGWKGYSNARERIFGEITDHIIRYVKADLMLFKPGEDPGMRRCLLPTAGGPNARMAAMVVDALSKQYETKTTVAYVVGPGASEAQCARGRESIRKTVDQPGLTMTYSEKVIESDSVASGIAKSGRDYDLVAIGATEEPFFRKMLFGEIPEKIARFSPTSVLVVKEYEGAVKSIVKKAIG